jgi:hypothetical protein
MQPFELLEGKLYLQSVIFRVSDHLCPFLKKNLTSQRYFALVRLRTYRSSLKLTETPNIIQDRTPIQTCAAVAMAAYFWYLNMESL